MKGWRSKGPMDWGFLAKLFAAALLGMAVFALLMGCEKEEAMARTAPGDMKIVAVGASVERPLAARAVTRSLPEVFARVIEPVPPPAGSSPFGIVGGTPAHLGDYPGRVKIEIATWSPDHDQFAIEHCAGDLITRDRVDTAAHCISEGWSWIKVYYGDAQRSLATEASVAAAIQHSGYRTAGDGRDIAVLMLAEPVPEGVETRRYASAAEVVKWIGKEVPIASWGLTGAPQDMSSNIPDQLLETRIRIVSADNLMIEAEAVNGSGDCQGGSGTGLGSSVTMGRFSGVYPEPDGSTCRSKDYRMSFVSPDFAGPWGDAAAAAWRAERGG